MADAKQGSASGAEAFGYKQELRRALGVWDLVILGVVMGIPIGVCLIYGYIICVAKGSITLVYIIAAIGMILTGNSYARMSYAFPLAGGAYAFVSRGLNKTVGFLVGWAMVGMYIVLLPLLYIFGAYALYAIFPAVPLYVWMLAFIIINTVINYRGIEVTREVLKYVCFGGLAMYGWFIVAGVAAIAHGVSGATFTAIPIYNKDSFSLGAIMAGVSIAVFNFGGPDALTTLGEETKGGVRTIGAGVLLAFAVLGGLFISLTYVGALIWPDYTTHTNADIAFYEIAAVAGGPVLKFAFSLAVIITLVFGCTLCAQACSSRVLYAMARDNMFPKFLAKIHPIYKSPYVGIFAIGLSALIICFAFADKGEVLTSIANFSMLSVWSLVNITTIYYYILEKRSNNYLRDLVYPTLGLLLLGYTFISLKGEAKIAGVIWIVIGTLFMAYLRFVKKVDVSFSSDAGL